MKGLTIVAGKDLLGHCGLLCWLWPFDIRNHYQRFKMMHAHRKRNTYVCCPDLWSVLSLFLPFFEVTYVMGRLQLGMSLNPTRVYINRNVDIQTVTTNSWTLRTYRLNDVVMDQEGTEFQSSLQSCLDLLVNRESSTNVEDWTHETYADLFVFILRDDTDKRSVKRRYVYRLKVSDLGDIFLTTCRNPDQ